MCYGGFVWTLLHRSSVWRRVCDRIAYLCQLLHVFTLQDVSRFQLDVGGAWSSNPFHAKKPTLAVPTAWAYVERKAANAGAHAPFAWPADMPAKLSYRGLTKPFGSALNDNADAQVPLSARKKKHDFTVVTLPPPPESAPPPEPSVPQSMTSEGSDFVWPTTSITPDRDAGFRSAPRGHIGTRVLRKSLVRRQAAAEAAEAGLAPPIAHTSKLARRLGVIIPPPLPSEDPPQAPDGEWSDGAFTPASPDVVVPSLSVRRLQRGQSRNTQPQRSLSPTRSAKPGSAVDSMAMYRSPAARTRVPLTPNRLADTRTPRHGPSTVRTSELEAI